MARFDVHRLAGDGGLVIDVQADLLSDLSTRLVIPLVPAGREPFGLVRLNPRFSIDTIDYVLMPHLMGAVRRADLGARVGDLRHARDRIVAAIDMALQGF